MWVARYSYPPPAPKTTLLCVEIVDPSARSFPFQRGASAAKASACSLVRGKSTRPLLLFPEPELPGFVSVPVRW